VYKFKVEIEGIALELTTEPNESGLFIDPEMLPNTDYLYTAQRQGGSDVHIMDGPVEDVLIGV
jgi:hypothetical protein